MTKYAVLVKYIRVLSETLDPPGILKALADLSVDGLGAGGSVVFETQPDGSQVIVESRNILQDALPKSRLAAVTPETADRIMAGCGGEFRSSRIIPLVGRGNLYGALILFYRELTQPEEKLELAEALSDISALGLYSRGEYSKLKRAYAELKSSQQALAHSEKLRILGEMSATIAHDIKNILQPILTGSQIIRGIQDIPERARKAADLMEGAAKRGLEIVDRLRIYSRRTEGEPSDLRDPGELIDEAIEILRPRLKGSVKIQLNIHTRIPIFVKASDFVSSIVNLIVNANDAITAPDGLIQVTAGTDVKGLWIEVSDNGPGIPEEMKEKLFQPFFTTKGEAGTGLGLAAVQRFIKDSHGSISFRSESGRGTTFRLTFPILQQKAA